MDPKFADMHKLTLLYGNSISLYNESHKKFLHCFADAKLQEKIVDLAVQRLNCPNPLAEDLDWQFDISLAQMKLIQIGQIGQSVI